MNSRDNHNSPDNNGDDDRDEQTSSWFDRVVTPMNACSLETASVSTKPEETSLACMNPCDTRLPLIIGCYQLDEAAAVEANENTAQCQVTYISTTIQAVIFKPSAYKSGVSVTGTVVYLDLSIGRMDLSDDGAKLIVDVSRVDPSATNGLRTGQNVTADGTLKRRQRRLFLDAMSLCIEGGDDDNDEHADKPIRNGELRLYMIPSSPSTSQSLQPINGNGKTDKNLSFGDVTCVVKMESGVLDGKWRRRHKFSQNSFNSVDRHIPTFASACASGRIHLHSLENSVPQSPSLSLRNLASSGKPSSGNTPLCLSLAWNDFIDMYSNSPSNTISDQIVSSYSDGTVALHEVLLSGNSGNEDNRGGSITIVETQRWNAHSMFGNPSEVWTCSFLRGNEHTVISGADDCSLKMWDLRLLSSSLCQTQKPAHKIGNSEFEAGVTAISAHPLLDHVFAAGSYDETVRIYDSRKIDQPLAKGSVGGGIWRIKWHPSCWDGETHSCGKMLVAAMHGGCRVVNINLSSFLSSFTPSNDIEILSEFTEHESMAYGADWLWFGQSQCEAVASCSFYDNQAFLWDPYTKH